jgi:hypothetical protein
MLLQPIYISVVFLKNFLYYIGTYMNEPHTPSHQLINNKEKTEKTLYNPIMRSGADLSCVGEGEALISPMSSVLWGHDTCWGRR